MLLLRLEITHQNRAYSTYIDYCRYKQRDKITSLLESFHNK